MKRILGTKLVWTLCSAVAFAGCGGSEEGDVPDMGASDDGGDDVNHPPIAVDDSEETRQGEPVAIWLVINDTDPDEDDLIVAEVEQPENGFVEILSGNERVEYTSIGDFFGVDQFTYIVSDQNGGTDEGNVTINVTEIPVLTLTITAPEEDEVVTGTSVQVTFEVGGCSVSFPDQDRDGCHLHKLLDGEGYSGGGSGIGHYTPTPISVTGLTEGDHAFTLQLISNDGTDRPVVPPVADTVNFTVTP